MSEKYRCGWVKLTDPVYVAYHDEEWGKPLHDDRALFELFSLETQAAGLSWLTILKKRYGYREAFEGFEPERVAACTSPISDAITKELKKRGFKFIGSTTIYAFMQACGMVDDHENGCFCKAK